jgi:hypothetical protein
MPALLYMKLKYLFIFSLACLVFVFVPGYTDFARSIGDLRFYLVNDVNFFCPPEENEIALGCIFPEERVVLILRDLGEEERSFVAAHEIGHYYLYGFQPKDIETMIPSGKEKKEMQDYNVARGGKLDVIELSASLYYDYLYSREYLEDNYPEIKKLYDNLLTM